MFFTLRPICRQSRNQIAHAVITLAVKFVRRSVKIFRLVSLAGNGLLFAVKPIFNFCIRPAAIRIVEVVAICQIIVSQGGYQIFQLRRHVFGIG